MDFGVKYSASIKVPALMEILHMLLKNTKITNFHSHIFRRVVCSFKENEISINYQAVALV